MQILFQNCKLDKIAFIAHSKIFTLIKDNNQNDFSNRLENRFPFSVFRFEKSFLSISLIKVKLLHLRFLWSLLKSLKTLNVLKTVLKMMPISRYRTLQFSANSFKSSKLWFVIVNTWTLFLYKRIIIPSSIELLMMYLHSGILWFNNPSVWEYYHMEIQPIRGGGRIGL